MAVLQLTRIQIGEVGVLPGTVKMVSSDDLATITAAGYLNKVGNILLPSVALAPNDIIQCLYSYNAMTRNGTFTLLRVAISAGVITLSVTSGDDALTSAHIFVGNASNVATDVAMTGDIAITNAGVTSIASGVIVNADVNAAAAIDYSKLAALPSAEILVGSAGNVATAVAVTGDVTIGNTGVTAIGAGKVLLAMLGTGIAPSHVIKFADQVTTVGGAAAEAFVVTGAVGATDRAFVQVVDDGTANVTVLQAVVTDNTLTVTFSANPGNDTIINYQIIRAAS